MKSLREKLSVGVSMLVAALMLCQPVCAQTQSNDETETTAQVKILPPAYNDEMLRLAEILGSLHYIRELCGADEGQLWRTQMEDLLQKEEPTPDRRAALIAHFNRGFRGFQSSYRECTSAAIEANERYLFEGSKLAGLISTRYGR